MTGGGVWALGIVTGAKISDQAGESDGADSGINSSRASDGVVVESGPGLSAGSVGLISGAVGAGTGVG